jgi:hypothetical protein
MRTAIPLPVPSNRAPWNKGRLIGQKRPLKPKDVWAIRVRLQLQDWKRDLALFNLAIDSKLEAAISSACRWTTYALAAGRGIVAAWRDQALLG